MTDTYTKTRAREIIGRTVETIADMWPAGMSVDHEVARRFDESLVEAIRRGNLRTVENDCRKYQTWLAKKIARYSLG